MNDYRPLLCAAFLGAAVLACWPARAGLPADAPAQAAALASKAAQALAPRGARVLVQPGALDARLKLAPCQQVQAYLPAGVNPWGRSQIGLRCLQGPVAWQVFLPVTVQVMAPAVVSNVNLPAGARLDAGQLSLVEVDWAATSGTPQASADALQGRVLARPLAAGQAVQSTDLRARQWFGPGETVRLMAVGNGFAVTAEGLAMNPGVEGQPVRVRTESGRVVVGMPVGERQVELRL